jgi:hypothetical protein
MRNIVTVSIFILVLGSVLFLVSQAKLDKLKTLVSLDNQVAEVSQTQDARDDLLLPDLAIKDPTELYILGSGDSKKLRFNTTFVNLGPGTLEIIGHSDPESGVTHASQYIFAKGKPGQYREIGSFTLHPTHRHWHVENHVRYQLWTINSQGERNQMVADTGKMSFCLWDENSNDLSIKGAPQGRVYEFTCSRNTQGMSVGWGDTYNAGMDGQELNVATVPDGEYIISYEVNPDRKILETKYDNNLGEMIIRIEGSRVRF